MKRKPAVLIIAALAVSIVLSGCGVSKTGSSASSGSKSVSKSSDSSSKTNTLTSLALPYNSVTYFNPLMPASKSNMALWPLIYDCLSEPDENYDPVMRLASSVTSSGTTVSIKLKSGVKFTDGSTLTASDVKYTLDYVIANAQSPYNQRLSNVSSVGGSGYNVTLRLKSPDPLIANLLDIPIVKYGTGTKNNAVGTGQYKYAADGVNGVLVRNSRWYGGKSSRFGQISLVNIPYSDAIMSSLSVRDVNFVYSDDGSGLYSSASNTDTSRVNINQFVYLGVNSAKAHLNNSHFRRAISLSISRDTLVSQNYSNLAYAASIPYNPKWSKVKALNTGLDADYEKALSELKQGGGATGVTLTLLVNSDNQTRVNAAKYVITCLSKSGITVTLKSVPFAQYQSLIQSGNFDLYLGEVKLQSNMDLSPLIASGGAAAYGTTQNSAALKAFETWRSGTSNINSVVKSFKSDMPIIPLCFRTGLVSYTKGLSGIKATDNDVFLNFDEWK